MRTGKEFWNEAKDDLGYGKPAYYVTVEPIYGETRWHGPIKSASEARYEFDRTYPEFDGASVTIQKLESDNPWITPEQLRANAFREEYEINVDPEEKRWGAIFDKSRTTVAWDEWKVTQDQAGMIYRHVGKRYDMEFDYQVGLEQEKDRYEESEIATIHESEWHQGFGSEYKEHLGRDKDGGFYFATEHSESPEDDLCWQGPHATREEAEQGLIDAYDRWDKRTGEREQAHEDRQIAQLEQKQQRQEQKSENTTTQDNMQSMDNAFLRAGYDAQSLRVQQLESWIIEAISKPAMPRELRMEGLEMVQDISPTARLAVERICPSMSRSQGRELEISR
jgi:hypothetical protein